MHHHAIPTPRDAPSYPGMASKPVGQWISDIYRNRISQFTSDGQWSTENLLSMLYDKVSGDPHVKIDVWHAPGLTRPTFHEAVKHDFTPTKVGADFGPAWSSHWFRLTITVPEDLLKAELLELHWDANNEGMVWTMEGHPLQGLTGDGERVEWILPAKFRDGKPHTIFIEMACNGMFGNAPGDSTIDPPDPDRRYKLTRAEIAAVNLTARALYMDMWVIGDAARQFPTNSWEQHKALKTATSIIDTFRKGDRESLVRCRHIAQEYLGKNVDSHKVYRSEKETLVYGIGYCHIDTCWLWPWAETRRKVARSWSNQCDLMERYPELNFVCTQPQQFQWLKEDYPYVYNRVKAHVKGGQFHPIGGSWVEHDTNLPSGESLVRQFLFGQRFFQHHFDLRCTTFWLPDTFGYSGQIPQLCRLAGMPRFLTQKLSWNNINKFPHTSFNWVALDGTQVLCHMPPSETYTSNADLSDVIRSISQHKSLDHDNTSLLVFGKGDGGGGPTWQHLEKLRRYRGLSDEVGLLPRVHVGKTSDDFFQELEKKADKLVTWYGELYFELHRGTYTTQAKNKKYNREAENMLRELEFLATLVSLRFERYEYPKEEIDGIWEAVLLCQFHDCLPGSSIEMCYDDSDKVYAQVFATGKKLAEKARHLLSIQNKTPSSAKKAIVGNPLPTWERNELIDLDDGTVGITYGRGPFLAVRPFTTSRMTENGVKPLVQVEEAEANLFVMSNDRYRVRVEDGCIVSLYDRKNEREVIEPGAKANQFVLFDDKPLYWQAWDVEVYHLESRRELRASSTKVHEDRAAHRVTIESKIKISDVSSLTSYITLTAEADGKPSYIECRAEVDWHETMKFLKVEFPVSVRNTEASYETAFGITKRPTHFNTSWDMAKFEVCCHRFADLSEYNYGVSILNDCKYGFATSGHVMRLSLLRAPKAPDAHADMGHHTIRWAILPHQGPLGVETVRAAYTFNAPVRLFSAPESLVTQLSEEGSPVYLEGGEGNLVLDTVKRSEDEVEVIRNAEDKRPLHDREGRNVILRIYEALGGRGRAEVVVTTWRAEKMVKMNLLEDDDTSVPVIMGTERWGSQGREIRFPVELRPFEVATFRLQLAE